MYRDEVKRVNGKTLYLQGGSSLPCDLVLCGTGWKTGAGFFSSNLILELGLPHAKELEPDVVSEKWNRLLLEADKKVAQRFRLLRDPPPHPRKHLETTP